MCSAEHKEEHFILVSQERSMDLGCNQKLALERLVRISSPRSNVELQIVEMKVMENGSILEDSRNETVVQLMNPEMTENTMTGRERFSQPGLVLKFEHITLDIKEKRILSDISGCAKPGQVMAVMGPSGSGKTTLLNVIGGRVKCHGCRASIGGQPLTKKTRRQISYVLQEDIFFPNLTLKDTLMFSAELRLPESWSGKVKEKIVQEIVEQLEIDKCMKTIIGSAMERGLSGGEKKRANIANELLTDPAVLLLDEPTSGLDSTTAFALAQSLKRYAVKSNKTVLMTVHQPSSQMFFLFDTVMLMSHGRIAYYGSPNNVLQHFAGIGYSCDIPHYNPADFILDMAKLDEDQLNHIVAECNKIRANLPDCPILKSTLQESQSRERNEEKVDSAKAILAEQDNANENLLMLSLNDQLITSKSDSMEGNAVDDDVSNEFSDVTEESDKPQRTWTTSFWKQFKVLTHRSYIQGKSRYFSKLRVIKCLGVSLIVGLVWWQIGAGFPPEKKIADITALYFFSTLYNSFNPLFDVLQIFPSERVVINKERMAGSYRLSAYYLAKLASELPLTFIYPTVYTFITYWMAGLNGVNNIWVFFGALFVILLQAVACQSLGLFVSAATMDFEHSLVMAILIMIFFMLLGGFYVKNIPSWLTWSKYVSPITHAWALLLYFEFDSDTRFICDPDLSAYASCNATESYVETNVTAVHYVAHEEVLEKNNISAPAWIAVVSLFIILIVFRVLGYICLRFFHKPVMK